MWHWLWTYVNTTCTLNDVLNETVSDVVARRIKEVRLKRGLKAQDLAKRCAERGMPHLSAATLSNIETGRRDDEGRRRRNITVDELLVLADALDIAPVHLMVPIEGVEEYPVTPNLSTRSPVVRSWIRGYAAMDNQDARLYFADVPADEWKPPYAPDDEEIERRGRYTELTRRMLHGEQPGGVPEGRDGPSS